jgi:hypothetical protein
VLRVYSRWCIFMDAIPSCLLLNKSHVFKHNTGLFSFKLCIYECATCFSLYLGHPQACQYKNFIKEYTEVGKSRFTVVRMEKDMQVMIITIALLITIINRRQITQINNTINNNNNNNTRINSVSRTHNCKLTFAHPCIIKSKGSLVYSHHFMTLI